MRVLGIERTNLANNHYRIVQPIYKLFEQKLAEVSTLNMANLVGETEKSLDLIVGADIVVVYSPSNEEWLNLIKTLRKYGKIIVADYDDDPFNVSPWNPAYQWSGIKEVAYEWPDGTIDMLWSETMTGSRGETDFFNIEGNIKRRDLFKANFKKADLVTTTNAYLAQSLGQINPNVEILPNLVDFGQYPKCELVKKNIRIGWQGGSSHYEDLFMIVEPMRKVLQQNPDVTFVYSGDSRMLGLFKSFPKAQVEYHGWTDYKVYPYALTLLNLDIGLCPLANNEFNIRKSAIKYFEYSVVGAVTLASNIPPYSPVIKDGVDGVLVKDNDWEEAIKESIYSIRLINMAKKAYDNVYENHNADKKAHLWLNAYDKILKKELVEA